MSKNKLSKKKNTDLSIYENENNITFLLIEKCGDIKEVLFNNFNIDELYKKCGFRKPDNFICRNIWNSIKIGKSVHSIAVWSRNDGKGNTENKYDFPPPIDKDLYFGNCAILQIDSKTEKYKSITKDLWLKIYEKLFNGFETLTDTYENDENDVDELLDVKKELKTKKTGYLKDGFVVDSDEDDIESDSETIDDTSDNDEETNKDSETLSEELSDDEEDVDEEIDTIDNYEHKIKSKKNKNISKNKKIVSNIISKLQQCNFKSSDELLLDELANGSELTIEEYDYD
jgi:hypothetical protein